MDLRRVLRDYLVTGVYRRGEKVTLHFHPDAPIKGDRLVAFVQKDKGRSQLSPDLRLTCTLKQDEDVIIAVKTLLAGLNETM